MVLFCSSSSFADSFVVVWGFVDVVVLGVDVVTNSVTALGVVVNPDVELQGTDVLDVIVGSGINVVVDSVVVGLLDDGSVDGDGVVVVVVVSIGIAFVVAGVSVVVLVIAGAAVVSEYVLDIVVVDSHGTTCAVDKDAVGIVIS